MTSTRDLADYYDEQYNPARVAVAEFPGILDVWAERSAAVRATLDCRLDLSYGEAENQRLDYFPAQGSSRALMVFFHGGYWSFADKSDFSFLAPVFVEHGVSFASVNYDLLPQVTLEALIEQCRDAVGFIHANAAEFGAESGGIYLSGHSAGGHIVAMLMADPEAATAIRGGLSVSGVHDLEPFQTAEFLRPVLGLDSARSRSLSPVRLRPATAAPLCTAVGANEKAEFLRQTRALNDAWRGVLKETLEAKGANHFTIFDELTDPSRDLARMTFGLMGLPNPISRERHP